MKRLLIALGFLLAFASPAFASNCPSFTYTLTNGQTADANQVMANFNTLLNCSNNNLAHNGANSDITSLSALTSLSLPAATTSSATFTIPAGSAPTVPSNGNIWTTTSGLFAYLNGTTYQFTIDSNNLSDLTSASMARTNLGLGTAATVNTGTSGGTIPLLNAANTWSGKQTLFASTTSGAPFNIPQGTAPTSPSNGDCWTTSAAVQCQINGTTLTLASTSGAVTSFNTRTGAVTLLSTDISGASGVLTTGATMTGALVLPAATTSLAPLTIPHGTAPTSKSDGNCWTTTASLFCYLNSTTDQFMVAGNNLSDLASASTARTNLGVTATGSDTTYAYRANNLSDLASASTARTNLGLGTAATQNTGTSGANVPLMSTVNTWGATQEISSGSSASQLIVNQTTPATYNDDILYENNGSNAWDLSTRTTGNGDFWVYNFTTSQADIDCAKSNDVCNFYATPQAGGTNLVLTTDSRFGGPTQNSQSTSYTLALTDAGKQFYHPSTDTTARTLTIPANASVAFPVVTKIDVVNDCSAGALTIAITSDTLVWFPSGGTGSRTLAACGEATLTKVGTTRWIITGTGLS